MSKEINIRKNVLEKIHEGGVSMRSRISFMLRKIFFGALAALVFAAAIFVLSFAFFTIHESGEQFLLEFNERGLTTFMTLFPWMSMLLFLLLLVMLELLLRRFTNSYRFSLLRIFLWVLVFSIVGSTLIGLTPLHSFLLSEADHGRLPILGALYEEVHDSHNGQGVYRGKVTSINGTYFVISYDDSDRDSDEGTWNVMPPTGFDLSTLSVGEKLYVGGRLIHGVVYAYGIHSLPSKE